MSYIVIVVEELTGAIDGLEHSVKQWPGDDDPDVTAITLNETLPWFANCFDKSFHLNKSLAISDASN